MSTENRTVPPLSMFGPDFPFAYDDWLRHPAGLGELPQRLHGHEVAIVGAGMAGMTAAFELMRLGLKPVLYESRRIGGRLHSQSFQGAEDVVAELGGMRFPRSSTTFYHSKAFRELSFRHLEVFGQVGFGTGGWDTDFPNSMLEILRVVLTGCEDDQHFVLGGVEQVPRGLWRRPAGRMTHWPAGTTVASLNGFATRPAVAAIGRDEDGRLRIRDRWGDTRSYDAALVTCQSWLLTTHIRCQEQLFSQKLWMAMDRTRYMQSSKTFVMVDRPFWKDRDPRTGRDVMSMTLTDRVTRGTYLFDLGDDRPGVICLSYAWMSDALKMLPLSVDRRVELALETLETIYPELDIRAHMVGEPMTVSWEADPNFLGAFKGALPGHYRYNRRMFCHFMQADLPAPERGLFLAGDDIGWTPGWVEGAVQTALNAVWGILTHLGGHTHPDNPGPGDRFHDIAPVLLPE